MNVKPTIRHQYVSLILSNLVLALLALPSHADDGGVVGAIAGALSSAMQNNNQGTPDDNQ